MPVPNADGPDIAHYQTITGKPIDPLWQMCSHKATEGQYAFDKTFPARWDWMREQRFKYRGAYHWLRSDSTIASQAANLCAVIDRQGGLLRGDFIQCDWETTPNIPVPTSLMAAEWCDRVKQHYGRACTITYTGTWLPDSPLDTDTRREFLEWRDENPTAPLWLAYYNTTSGWAECAKYGADVWQWTSNYRHPSIVSPVVGAPARGFDMNHVFDFAVLDAITDQLPIPEPTPQPDPPEVLPVEYFVRFKGTVNVFHVGAGGAIHVEGTVLDKGRGVLGDPLVIDHKEMRVSVCHAAGIDPDWLTPNADGS